MRIGSWVGVALLVALAGCAKPPLDTGPARRPGLWDQHVVLAGRVQAGRLCLDAATDRQLSWWGVADHP